MYKSCIGNKTLKATAQSQYQGTPNGTTRFSLCCTFISFIHLAALSVTFVICK